MFDESGVPGIEQSVQTFALPKQSEVDPGTQHCGDALQSVHGDSVSMAALNSPNDRPRHAGAGRELPLRETSTQSQRPDTQAETDDIHPRRIAIDGAPPRMSPASWMPAFADNGW